MNRLLNDAKLPRGNNGNYRHDYYQQRDYRPGGNNGRDNGSDHGTSGASSDQKYERGAAKFEKYRNATADNAANQEVSNIDGYGTSPLQNENSGHMDSIIGGESAIASLETRIASVTQEMNQALNAVSGKENEKFDLIFSILIELQRKQHSLEESVRVLKNQLAGGTESTGTQQGDQSLQQSQQMQQMQGQNMSSQQQRMQQQMYVQMGTMNGQMSGPSTQVNGDMSGQMNAQMGGQMNGVNGNMSSSMNSQMNTQMGGQMNGVMNGHMNNVSYMGGQMNMNQMGFMIPANGSQGFPHMQQMVLVSGPTAGSMGQVMMPMSFQGQAQGGDDFQCGAGDARSDESYKQDPTQMSAPSSSMQAPLDQQHLPTEATCVEVTESAQNLKDTIQEIPSPCRG